MENIGTKKIIIYKILLYMYFIVYYLVAIEILKGVLITYASISYYYNNFGFDINDFFRALCYILLFVNLVIILIMTIKLILNKNTRMLSKIYCILHIIISIFYCLAYGNLFNLLFGIIPIIPYIFLYIMYKKYNLFRGKK